jgi:arylsulfatase A-like enzyme
MALDELGLSESTAVVVWSDHGFHLGDQARWAKWTQFESDMRSPMMIRMPRVGQKTRKTDALVESLDLYPTLADYCGLPRPDHLEGESLLPLIRGITDHAKPFAFSQVKGLQSEGHMLAYSVRTPRYRYVEWRDTKQAHRLVSRELYDLGTMGSETVNIAAKPERQEIVETCHQAVLAGYSSLSSLADGELH